MITASGQGLSRPSTKTRLLDEGVRLFAEQGFRETSVGQIEAAAGLEPRRGALYRHFASKEALLEAALAQHLESLGGGAVDDLQMGGDVRGDMEVLGRWLLGELDRERSIVRILEQDGDRLPALRDAFRQSLVDSGYMLATALARRWIGAADADLEAAVVVLMGGLINYRRSTWTFGAPPLGIDEERFLTAWIEICGRAAEALVSGPARTTTRRAGR